MKIECKHIRHFGPSILKAKIPEDLSLFLGSLAGAESVENIGNSNFINKDKLMRHLEFLIK